MCVNVSAVFCKLFSFFFFVYFYVLFYSGAFLQGPALQRYAVSTLYIAVPCFEKFSCILPHGFV